MRLRSTAVIAGAALALVLLLLLPGVPTAVGSLTVPARSAVEPLTGPTNVSYSSSYDSWPLSYLEYLPAGYAGAAAPLAVFLPGLGTSTSNVSGGIGGSTVPPQLVANASTFGFILISVNTRSTAGYYLNTPCGGHQQQDILDAITFEEARRTINNVYLIGFSGGSAGALALAGQHLVANLKGIATSGTITDMANTLYYDLYNNSDTGHYNAFVRDECGQAPNWVTPSGNGGQVPNRAAAQLFQLSQFRYYPSNFTSLRIFMAAGGRDTEAINNLTLYPFANVNSTLLGQYPKGCWRDVGDSPTPPDYSFGEPLFNFSTGISSLGCEGAYINLTGNPSFTFLYEPQATHSSLQLNYQDVFQYFLGERIGGVYTSTFPNPAILTPVVYSTERFPNIVNTGAVSCGTGAGSASPSLNTPTNDSLYVFVGLLTSTRWVTTVTDTAGDTFHMVKNVSVAGVEKEELWVVNSTAGSAANVISTSNSASASTCLWPVAIKGTRTSASYNFLGTSTTATNTTAGDAFATTSARDLVLSYTVSPVNNFYTSGYAWAIWNEHNLSTTFSAGAAFENALSTVANGLPQVTLGTSANWESLTVAVQAQPSPAAPVLSVAGVTKQAYNLSWTPPSGGGILNYTLWLGSNDSLSSGVCTNQESVALPASPTHYNVATNFNGFIQVRSGDKVCLRLTAWNATGIGTASSWLNFTLNGSSPPPPPQTGAGGLGLLPIFSLEDWLILVFGVVSVAALIAIIWKD